MASRKLFATAALTAAVAARGAAGGALGVPGVSSAQDQPTTTITPSNGSTDSRGGHLGPDAHGRFGGGVDLGAAAEALGLDEDVLRDALQDGTTLAQAAEVQGIDRQALIDALVAAGEHQLDELRAALPNTWSTSSTAPTIVAVATGGSAVASPTSATASAPPPMRST